MTSPTTRAGAAASASLPPLIAERCFRTQFISAMSAPLFSSARLIGALVVERETRRRRGEQRRAAAGDEAEHEIVGGQALHAFENAQRRLFPRGVRHGMGGFDHLDALRRRAMAVAGDDQAFERALPSRLDRCGHRRGGLAGADDDRASLRRQREETARACRPAKRRRSRRETGPSERRAVRPSLPTIPPGAPQHWPLFQAPRPP